MELILFLIIIVICICISYGLSKGIYEIFIVKQQKVKNEINWIYGIWIAILICVITLRFVFKVKIQEFTIINVIAIITSLIIWRVSLSLGNLILAQIFIVLNVFFVGLNIYLNLDANLYYLISLFFLITWMITIAFLTFKISSDDIADVKDSKN